MKDIIVNFTEEGYIFINLFKELENVIKNKCKVAGINTENKKMHLLIDELSKKNSVVRRNKKELDLMRDVRNLNSHEFAKEYGYVVCPNPEMNSRLKSIIEEITNPPTIYTSNMSIKRQEMYCKSLEDNIETTIKDMIDKVYTHIPIIENEVLIGVFSENTLLDIVNAKGGIIIDEDTKFNEIVDYIKIEEHSTEEFLFVSRNTNIYDVEDLFKDYFIKKKRLGCVYITEHGKENEKILGMTTAWDVLGN